MTLKSSRASERTALLASLVRGRTSRALLVFGLALVITVAPQIARAAPQERTTPSAPSHRVVGLTECTFIDPTRGVLDYSSTPATVRSTHRTLLTEIRYPAMSVATSTQVRSAAPIRRAQGYPLVVFAHGYDVTPDVYAPLLDRWTAAGFVVVAPLFPDEKPSTITAEAGADTEGDLRNEPGDLAFVTARILAASTGASRGCGQLRGMVRPTQIALAGHSDGADAVAMLAYDHGLDPQGVPFVHLHAGIAIRAVVILAGAQVPPDRYDTEVGHPSLLVVQSRADSCNPFWQGLQLYRSVHQPNKWFLELATAHHLPAFDGADPRAFADVAAITSRFLALSLGVTRGAPSLAHYGDRQPTVARIYDTLLGPPLRSAPTLAPFCGLN